MIASLHQIISPSLSPNTQIDDVWESLKIILTPWKWTEGESIGRVEDWFHKKFNTPFVWSFNSGRSALYSILKAFEIKPGDEILIQAFTCVAVPNCILWVGAKP